MENWKFKDSILLEGKWIVLYLQLHEVVTKVCDPIPRSNPRPDNVFCNGAGPSILVLELRHQAVNLYK